MLYVVSEKFFKKNAVKFAKYNEMFILDGANYSVLDRGADYVAIATKYSRAHACGGFCPETRLYGMLRKKKRGEEINEDKYLKEIKEFLRDKGFIASICAAYKALIAGGPEYPMNVFVVLPNIVYKYLGKKIMKKMIKVADLEFNCVFSQEDLEDDMKRLKVLLNREQMKRVDKATKKIEKKYDLKYSADDDD